MLNIGGSLGKRAFFKASQKPILELQAKYLEAGGTGIRAQACDR